MVTVTYEDGGPYYNKKEFWNQHGITHDAKLTCIQEWCYNDDKKCSNMDKIRNRIYTVNGNFKPLNRW